MASSQRNKDNQEFREKVIKAVSDFLMENWIPRGNAQDAGADQGGEWIHRTGSNTIAFPFELNNGPEWLELKFAIPNGERAKDGKPACPYDGFTEAEFYAEKVANDKEKAVKAAKEKEKKIAFDQKRREQARERETENKA